MATTAKPRSRRSSLAFERILDAAVRQIALEGIQSVRLAQIAKDAGVSVSLIHYHFATRVTLLEEALIHAYARADRDREMWERAQSHLTHSQQVVNMVDRMLPSDQEPQFQEWRLRVELWLQAIRNPDLKPVASELYAGWQRWWSNVITDGIRSGEFSDCDVLQTTDRVLALIDGYGIRAQIDPERALDWTRTELLQFLSSVLNTELKPPVGRTGR